MDERPGEGFSIEALDAVIEAVKPPDVLHITPRQARWACRIGFAEYRDWGDDPQFRGLFRRDRDRLVEERRERASVNVNRPVFLESS